MRLYLINPSNPLVSVVNVKESRWNRYHLWKPLGLMILAGLTPPEWDISIFDENLDVPDYTALPRPDLVGITACTSQAVRAYELAAHFRNQDVPVVMGGIHVTMCIDEAMMYVDSVVTGEADTIWQQVLEDAQLGRLKRRYDGGLADMNNIKFARHDLLDSGYFLGSIQTTRGCPLNCSFCSVTAFNGVHYRQRPIQDVVREFQLVREKRVLIVDDNLIGTRPEHIDRAKDLFRAMIKANLQKEWVAQVTINFADDEELLALAAKAGCSGVLIGFESPEPDGLLELGKKFNLRKGRNFHASVRRIQRHNIMVVGSFMIGLEIDKTGIGKHVAKVANQYGLDSLNVLFMTPLPGTRLWDKMKSEDRIIFATFPEDWKFYTLTYPVARYRQLSMDNIIKEMISCIREFNSMPHIFHRVWSCFWQRRKLLINLLANLQIRGNTRVTCKALADFKRQHGKRVDFQDRVQRKPITT